MIKGLVESTEQWYKNVGEKLFVDITSRKNVKIMSQYQEMGRKNMGDANAI